MYNTESGIRSLGSVIESEPGTSGYDTIVFDANHNYVDGEMVLYRDAGGPDIGLDDGRDPLIYYVILVADDKTTDPQLR